VSDFGTPGRRGGLCEQIIRSHGAQAKNPGGSGKAKKAHKIMIAGGNFLLKIRGMALLDCGKWGIRNERGR